MDCQFKEIVVTSLPEYTTEVLKIRDAWSKEWKEEEVYIDPWYRGEPESNTSLIPGLFRNVTQREISERLKTEWELRDEFELRARNFLDGVTLSQNDEQNWDLYFLMQHYGVPTRILDWTESPLLSLYFALRGSIEKKEEVWVWALHPWLLNKSVMKKPEILPSYDKKYLRYLPGIGKDYKLPEYPAAFNVPYITPRIIAQKSCFTIHGRNLKGLLTISDCGKFIKKIRIIKKDSLIYLRNDLRSLGISEISVFPDLDGLGRDLRSRWLF